jgi:hypothetical protein
VRGIRDDFLHRRGLAEVGEERDYWGFVDERAQMVELGRSLGV